MELVLDGIPRITSTDTTVTSDTTESSRDFHGPAVKSVSNKLGSSDDIECKKVEEQKTAASPQRMPVKESLGSETGLHQTGLLHAEAMMEAVPSMPGPKLMSEVASLSTTANWDFEDFLASVNQGSSQRQESTSDSLQRQDLKQGQQQGQVDKAVEKPETQREMDIIVKSVTLPSSSSTDEEAKIQKEPHNNLEGHHPVQGHSEIQSEKPVIDKSAILTPLSSTEEEALARKKPPNNLEGHHLVQGQSEIQGEQDKIDKCTMLPPSSSTLEAETKGESPNLLEGHQPVQGQSEIQGEQGILDKCTTPPPSSSTVEDETNGESPNLLEGHQPVQGQSEIQGEQGIIDKCTTPPPSSSTVEDETNGESPNLLEGHQPVQGQSEIQGEQGILDKCTTPPPSSSTVEDETNGESPNLLEGHHPIQSEIQGEKDMMNKSTILPPSSSTDEEAKATKESPNHSEQEDGRVKSPNPTPDTDCQDESTFGRPFAQIPVPTGSGHDNPDAESPTFAQVPRAPLPIHPVALGTAVYINQNDVDPTPSDEDAEESFSEKQQTSDPLGMEHRSPVHLATDVGIQRDSGMDEGATGEREESPKLEKTKDGSKLDNKDVHISNVKSLADIGMLIDVTDIKEEKADDGSYTESDWTASNVEAGIGANIPVPILPKPNVHRKHFPVVKRENNADVTEPSSPGKNRPLGLDFINQTVVKGPVTDIEPKRVRKALYACKFCPVKNRIKSIVHVHATSHNISANFICLPCGITFRDEAAARAHACPKAAEMQSWPAYKVSPLQDIKSPGKTPKISLEDITKDVKYRKVSWPRSKLKIISTKLVGAKKWKTVPNKMLPRILVKKCTSVRTQQVRKKSVLTSQRKGQKRSRCKPDIRGIRVPLKTKVPKSTVCQAFQPIVVLDDVLRTHHPAQITMKLSGLGSKSHCTLDKVKRRSGDSNTWSTHPQALDNSAGLINGTVARGPIKYLQPIRVNQYSYTCRYCRFTDKEESVVMSHIRTHETFNDDFACLTCYMDFKDKYMAESHFCPEADKIKPSLLKAIEKEETLRNAQISKMTKKGRVSPRSPNPSGSKGVPTFMSLGQKLGENVLPEIINRTVIEGPVEALEPELSKGKYTCCYCKYQNRRKGLVISHSQSHATSSNFACLTCNEEFNHRWEAVTHFCPNADQIHSFLSRTLRRRLRQRPRQQGPVKDQQAPVEPVDLGLTKTTVKKRRRSSAGETDSPRLINGTVLKGPVVDIEPFKLNQHMYACKYCLFKHTTKDIVVGHATWHQSSSAYVCLTCGMEFSHKLTTEGHHCPRAAQVRPELGPRKKRRLSDK